MKYLAVLGRQPEISIAELVLGGSCRLLSSPKIDGNFGGPPPKPSPVHAMLILYIGGCKNIFFVIQELAENRIGVV